MCCERPQQHHLHHMPCRPQEDIRHQASFPHHDHQELTKVFHLRSPGRTPLRVYSFPYLFGHGGMCSNAPEKQFFTLRGIKSVCPFLLIWSEPSRSLKFFPTMTTRRCWMTKMSAGDFGPAIIKAPREWNPSSAPCPWDSMTAGTRFSSTCRILPGGPTEPTTLRLSASRLAGAAGSEQSISPAPPSVTNCPIDFPLRSTQTVE